MTLLIQEPAQPVTIYQGPLWTAPKWSCEALVFGYWATNSTRGMPAYADGKWIQQ